MGLYDPNGNNFYKSGKDILVMAKKFFITTAIAYPNGKPHMGHALEIIQADALARFYRLQGKDVFFQTGTDEHGTKNWRTAQKEGKSIIEFLDANVSVFKDLYKLLNVSYDNFIRTSDKVQHYPGVQKLWKKLAESGDLYKQKYEGLYCVGCESFKTEKELVDGKCPNHPTREIERIHEENYFFKLSKYKNALIKLIESDEYKVVPVSKKNEILSFLQDVKDVSFSRPKVTLQWGIPVPGDDNQVMYVWCDALSNYITGAGYGVDDSKFNSTWPCDLHVIGKDILRFHAAIWPAMLISAKVPLPKELFVHGFINMSGVKMGKSTGNVVDPFEQIKSYGVDNFRYYVLEAMPLEGDGDYSEELLVEKINNELVANIANFCYRVLSFCNRTLNSEIKTFEQTPAVKEIITVITSKYDVVKSHYESRDFKQAITSILEISAIGNKFFQESEPWKNKEKSSEIIALCTNIIKDVVILISPIIPEFASKIENQLNLKNLKWKDLGFTLKNHKINKAEIILKNIEKKVEEKFPLNLKVAEVKEAKLHPNSEKLIVMQIDIGEEKPRQLVAGIQKYYKPEQLIGKKIIVVSNLKAAKLGGELSQGMLLAASSPDEKEVIVLEANALPGTDVVCGSLKNDTKEISIEHFSKLKIVSKGKNAFVENFNSNLNVNGKPVNLNVADGYEIG